jgi:UDPglucose 6-dehydrogenase
VAQGREQLLDLEQPAANAHQRPDAEHGPHRVEPGADAADAEKAEMSEQQPIGVVGVGWVGLVTATCFAELGHRVIARDIVPEKVEALRRGEVPFHEPGLGELLAKNRERLEFTTEMGDVLEAARLIFVCVDTPPTYSGDADLSRVMAVVDELRGDGGHALVMKSTVPGGTGAMIRRELPGVPYVSCPEFLKEGTAVEDFLHPDRVVIGVEPEDRLAGDEVERQFAPLDAEVVRTDITSAEMIKLASNAFLATKVSFINEIANVCDEVGADVREVARGMGLDQRIGPKFLQAGIGYGGSCFPKDLDSLKQLAGNTGYHFQLLTAVIEVNELQKRRVVKKLKKHLGSLPNKRIALLGLSFKPHTDDMREASSLVLASRLQGEGADVRAYDPVAEERARELLPAVEISPTAMDALDGADGAVLVTEWPEFAELDWSEAANRMAKPLIVDGRNFLDPEALKAAGFTYEAIGRPGSDRAAGEPSS